MEKERMHQKQEEDAFGRERWEETGDAITSLLSDWGTAGRNRTEQHALSVSEFVSNWNRIFFRLFFFIFDFVEKKRWKFVFFLPFSRFLYQ